MNIISEKCKKVLQDHEGSQFQGLFLYSSMEQDQSTPMSDIDLRSGIVSSPDIEEFEANLSRARQAINSEYCYNLLSAYPWKGWISRPRNPRLRFTTAVP